MRGNLILYSVNWTQIDTLVDGAVLWIKTHDYFSSAAIYDCTIRLSNCQMRQRSTENTHLRQHQGLSYLKSLRRIWRAIFQDQITYSGDGPVCLYGPPYDFD